MYRVGVLRESPKLTLRIGSNWLIIIVYNMLPIVKVDPILCMPLLSVCP